MCLYPKLIENRKFRANKKNGGIVPPLPLAVSATGNVIKDERVRWVPVGCGKCIECKRKKAREWNVRLLEEIREGRKAEFVTLTFSNEAIKELSTGSRLDGYERDNEIAKKGMRRFLERWRKKYKKSVRHWMVTELGHEGTENIHMHGIIWTEERHEIERIWQYGYVYIGDYVNEKTINYITKYVNKMDVQHKEYNPKILTSAGIGSGYLKREDSRNNKYKGVKGEKTDETYKNRQGYKLGMPIYYRNHIYTEEQRQELWLNKLDEEVRYVNGQKIDVSNGNDEEYFRAVEYARIQNERLGYGDDKINWERKRYEREQRNMNYKKRTNKDKE